MIKITIGDANGRTSVLVPETKTPREVASDNGVCISENSTTLNGKTLTSAELDTPLANLGVSDQAFILSYPKADGN